MALAFLVSCLISVASFNDWIWRVFMTNSALNYSDMLSSLLPPCPVAPVLWASSAPCPPSVPRIPSATRTASLYVQKESFSKCRNTDFLTQADYFKAPTPTLVWNSALCFSLLLFQLFQLKLLVVLVTVRDVAFPHRQPVCMGPSPTITAALFKAFLI